VAWSAGDRPQQVRDDRFRSRLGQRDSTARQARLRPPGLAYPGSRRSVPAPGSAAQSVGPVHQPPGWSRQRDIERIADQQHQEAAPTPGTTNAPRRTRSTSRGPRAQPRGPPHSIPPRLRVEGHRSGEHVPPQRFTRHHDQRREGDDEEAGSSCAQELPDHTNAPHHCIMREPGSGWPSSDAVGRSYDRRRTRLPSLLLSLRSPEETVPGPAAGSSMPYGNRPAG
jgi:hypothetical protein